MLTTMKHRTFLPFLKIPLHFLRFPTEKPTFSEPETYGSAWRTYVSLMGNIKISPINRDLHKDISVSS